MLKQPEEIQEAYSKAATAEGYIERRFTSAWGSVMHATQVRVVNDAIRAHRVERVLEIAPGPARLSFDVTGFTHGFLCEFNDSMLRVAKQRLASTNGRWRIMRGDAFHLPVQPGFDMVYTFRFIRHFEAADRTRLYSQIHSVLKDQGLLVFDVVTATTGYQARMRDGLAKHPIYDEFYQKAPLEQELRDHGFEVLSFTDVMRHMRLQERIQVLVGPRSHALARWMIETLEQIPGDPLEWVVVCRKLR